MGTPQEDPMLSKGEIDKDTAQEYVASGVDTVGRIAGIIINSVREVATEIGTFATNVFEIREANRRAREDNPE
jgi:hypothetical protein